MSRSLRCREERDSWAECINDWQCKCLRTIRLWLRLGRHTGRFGLGGFIPGFGLYMEDDELQARVVLEDPRFQQCDFSGAVCDAAISALSWHQVRNEMSATIAPALIHRATANGPRTLV